MGNSSSLSVTVHDIVFLGEKNIKYKKTIPLLCKSFIYEHILYIFSVFKKSKMFKFYL